MFYDKESFAAVAARKQTLEKVAKEKMLIAGAHIPFLGLGTVTTVSVGFVFRTVM